MKHYFLDTSALVKLYALEPGYKRVRDMMRSASVHPPASHVYVCDLAHPESASALVQILTGPNAAKRGLGRFDARRLVRDLSQDFASASKVTVTLASGVINRAAELVWKHRLRGADAVHLAAALDLRTGAANETEFYFVGADKQQNTAAAAEGLAVIDPTV